MHRIGNRLTPVIFIVAAVALIASVVGPISAALGDPAGRAEAIGAAAGVAVPAAVVLVVCMCIAVASLVGRWRLARRRRQAASHPPGKNQWVADPSASEALRAGAATARPTLQELRHVVGIGETRQLEQAKFQLLSLEVYADGFLIRGRLRYLLPPPPAGSGHVQHPIISFRVHDDGGRMYQVSVVSGGGSGFGGGWYTWEFHSPGAPRLDPAARELQIVVEALRWVPFRPAPQRWSYTLDLPPGGWRFAVALPKPA